MKNNLHIYPSPLVNETRIFKEIKSIYELNYFDNIYLAGISKENLPVEENLASVKIRRFHLNRTNRNLIFEFIKFPIFCLNVFFYFRKKEIKVVNCHSLHVLPIGVLFKVFKKSQLIYDTHELETEVSSAQGLKKKFAKLLERFLIKFVDQIISVNVSIKDWYKREYNFSESNLFVVRNIPSAYVLPLNTDYLRKHFGIIGNATVFIYIGIIGKGRGIEILINAFNQLDKTKCLVLLGPINDKVFLDNLNIKNNNIHIHPPVDSKEISTVACSADVAFCLFEKTSLSHYFVLPNKLFESFYSHLPVIASDFPELNNFIVNKEMGWSIPPEDISGLVSLIEKINSVDINVKKANVIKEVKNLSWEQEALEYKTIYKTWKK
jgi:glycosyltransferase involved in cell wall biosynthesis